MLARVIVARIVPMIVIVVVVSVPRAHSSIVAGRSPHP